MGCEADTSIITLHFTCLTFGTPSARHWKSSARSLQDAISHPSTAHIWVLHCAGKLINSPSPNPQTVGCRVPLFPGFGSSKLPRRTSRSPAASAFQNSICATWSENSNALSLSATLSRERKCDLLIHQNVTLASIQLPNREGQGALSHSKCGRTSCQESPQTTAKEEGKSIK